MIVTWSIRARADLHDIRSFIGERNPEAAARTANAIISTSHRLEEFPAIGRPSQIAGVRELVVLGTPYILFYRVIDHGVEITAVLHGAQRRPTR